MPWGLSRSDPAPYQGDLNAVYWKMEQAREKQPMATSSQLRKALKAVKAVTVPTTVEEFREFTNRTTALLAGKLTKASQHTLLSMITDGAYATLPEKERVKDALLEARASGKYMIRELSSQGELGQTHLRDIISTLAAGPNELSASQSVVDVLRKMADADTRRTDLIQRDLFTVQEADQYPSVWAALFQDYVVSLQRELHEITSAAPKLNRDINDAVALCEDVLRWCTRERDALLEHLAEQTQRQVQAHLGKPIKGLRRDEWAAISGFASLDDQAACAQSIHTIGKDSLTHMLGHLRRVASRFPAAQQDGSSDKKAELNRIYAADHRRWVALGVRGERAAEAPVSSRSLGEYQSYFSEQLSRLDIMQAKASEMVSRKAEVLAQLRSMAHVQLEGPVRIRF